ncbi:MAG: hypothetical protein ACM31L_07860 [Actinomycetota bacterium]
MIRILAAAYPNGHRWIKLARVDGDPEAIRNRIRHVQEQYLPNADSQGGVYETLADAKSALMRNYGIGWFNLARGQLRRLEEAERGKM